MYILIESNKIKNNHQMTPSSIAQQSTLYLKNNTTSHSYSILKTFIIFPKIYLKAFTKANTYLPDMTIAAVHAKAFSTTNWVKMTNFVDLMNFHYFSKDTTTTMNCCSTSQKSTNCLHALKNSNCSFPSCH